MHESYTKFTYKFENIDNLYQRCSNNICVISMYDIISNDLVLLSFIVNL
jgi:hypothetical protein